MRASYPVYRYGLILSTTRPVSLDQAKRISQLFVDQQESYFHASRQAVKKTGGEGIRRVPGEELREHPERAGIFDLPAQIFTSQRFRIKSRSTVTLCVEEKRSKIWSRLTCVKVDNRPAEQLTPTILREFFRQAQTSARAISRSILRVYRHQIASQGVELSATDEYSFRFRAFNCQRPYVADLCSDLRQHMTLQEALKKDLYGRHLRDFFGIALDRGETPSNKKILNYLKRDNHDIFAYDSGGKQTIYTIKVTDRATDLCGFGFDPRHVPSPELLAQATTGELADEYAATL